MKTKTRLNREFRKIASKGELKKRTLGERKTNNLYKFNPIFKKYKQS
ncbi:MAG: hypothetical protein ACYCT7_07335 [bacterium]